MFSIAYGRPLMIDNTTVPLPEMIDNERAQLPDNELHSQDVIPRYGTFIYSSPLFGIMRQIMNDMYQPDEVANKSQPEDLLNKAVIINRKLDELAESLPASLQYMRMQSQVSAHDGNIRLQQHVITRR